MNVSVLSILAIIVPYFLDVLGIVFYYSDVENCSNRSCRTVFLTILCLLIILPQYAASSQIPWMTVRFFSRLCCAFFFQLINKKASIRESLYNALTYHICYTACLIITMTPIFTVWREDLSLRILGNTQYNIAIGLCISSLFFYLFVLLKRRTIRTPCQRNPSFGAYAQVIFFNVVQQTLKSLHRNVDVHNSNTPLQLTFYAVVAQISIVSAYIILERYLYTLEINRQMELAHQADMYKQQNIEDSAKAISVISKINHDMHNHLTLLRSMTDSKQIEDYIDALLEQTSPIYQVFNTGNATIDGILNAKTKKADDFAIRIIAQVDGSIFTFLSAIDLCSIWGNALDNAIEACSRVDEDLRVIYITTGEFANHAVFKISNRYIGNLRFANGYPLTTKSDKNVHGIGLYSIRQTAEKYGGTVVASTEEDMTFVLTVTIPLPT